MSTTRPIGIKTGKWLVIAMILMMIHPKMIKAQELTSLDLDQAVRMAVEHDYEVRSSGNDLEKAKLAVKEKQIDNLPKVQIGAQAGKNLSQSKNIQNLSATVEQTIPTKYQLYGQKTVSDVETAKWDQQSTEAQYLISRAEVVYNTVSLYLEALKKQRIVEYQEMAVKNAEAEAEYAARQLSIGKVTKVTQLTKENDLAKARYQLESDRQDYLVAMKKLARQIGVKDYRSLKLSPAVSQISFDAREYEKLQASALHKRLELRQYQIAIQKAEADLAELANESLPSLSLAYQNRSEKQSYNLEYNFLSGDFTWSTALQQQYVEEFRTSDTDDVFGPHKDLLKLVLSWTIDCGSVKNKIQQANFTLENAKLAYLQSEQDITAEIDEALSAYDLALSNINLTQQAVALYQKNLELVKLQYKLGTATSFDVADAELELMNAQVEVDNAQCDLRLAAEKLRLKSGELYDYAGK